MVRSDTKHLLFSFNLRVIYYRIIGFQKSAGSCTRWKKCCEFKDVNNNLFHFSVYYYVSTNIPEDIEPRICLVIIVRNSHRYYTLDTIVRWRFLHNGRVTWLLRESNVRPSLIIPWGFDVGRCSTTCIYLTDHPERHIAKRRHNPSITITGRFRQIRIST